MGRFSEKAAYVGFFLMCISKRLNFDGWAAIWHDLSAVILGFGIFVEGARLTQLPMLGTFIAI